MPTCSGYGIEYFERPYRYDRYPFLLSDNELVGFSGVIFSQPAYAALTDKRLFTVPDDHPVDSTVKLYVNKGANVTITVEPDANATGYESGCVNYADYICDIRDLLDDVFALHSSDSQHTATAHKIAHLQRQRLPYQPLDATSASGTLDTDYVHAAPVAATPSGSELGASGIQDIDIDEINYQPFVRPSKYDTSPILGRNVPSSPFFPTVIKTGGSIPAFGPKDQEVFDELALDVASSGSKLLITGDRLLSDSSIKVMSDGSGSTIAATGDFVEGIPWALYPAKDEMCRYIPQSGVTPSGAPSGATPLITASGRQALYEPPSLSQGVYLTAVSETGATSGNVIQHYPGPGFWHSTSGVDLPSGINYHDGLYVEDRLLYSLLEMQPNQMAGGRSLQNGRVVFAHVVNEDSNSLGKQFEGDNLSFVDGDDTVYSFAGTTDFEDFRVGDTPVRRHTHSWASIDNTLSPTNFSESTVTELGVRYDIAAKTPGENDGAAYATLILYNSYGFLDYWCKSGGPTTLSTLQTARIVYTTRIYLEGVEQPNSPQIKTQVFPYHTGLFNMKNFYSFFIARNAYKTMLNVNGEAMFQFGRGFGNNLRRAGRILAKPNSYVTRDYPPAARSVRCVSIGYFPAWKILCYITTNNQVTLPQEIGTFAQFQILNAPGFPHFLDDDVQEYGPVTWDSVNMVNYLYVKLTNDTFWFCKMNTDYQIFEANKVTAADAILFGKAGILSL